VQRRVRSVLVGCALIGLVATSSAAARSSSHHRAAAQRRLPVSALSHHGRWLTDRSGRVVIVHGFNIVAKIPPYEPGLAGLDGADAAFLQRHGFNAVRLGVIFKGLEPKPGHFDEAYLDSIVHSIDLLGRHHIYSLVDFHQDLYNERFQGEGLPDWAIEDDGLPAQPQAGFPGNYFAMPALWRAFDHLWANSPGPRGRGLADWYAGAWRHVAKRLRGNPAVLGYDIFNEPFPGSQYVECFPPEGCASRDKRALRPFMAKVVHAIHAVDPHHIAFVEPWVTFDYSAPTYLGKVGDRNTGFSFHPYCFAALNLPVPDKGPARTACTQLDESRVFDNAESQQKASGEVPLVSEFGATSDASELNTIIGLAAKHRMGWLDWAYCECGDPTGAGSAESLVYDARKPPRGANINVGNLHALDVPYPMVVAGTPLHLGLPTVTGAVSFSYSTRAPSGHVFHHGVTRIHVPRWRYPHGYRIARLTGARVVSKPNAATLILRSRPHAMRVSVRVVKAK
jgi:endoglycosylceramidase